MMPKPYETDCVVNWSLGNLLDKTEIYRGDLGVVLDVFHDDMLCPWYLLDEPKKVLWCKDGEV